MRRHYAIADGDDGKLKVTARRPKYRRNLLILIGAFFLAPFGCLVLAEVLSSVVFDNSDCINIHDNRYFTLPANATSVDTGSYEDSVSCTRWIRFSIPSSELESFVGTTLISLPLAETVAPRIDAMLDYLEEETSWEFDALTASLSGEGDAPVNSSPAGQRIFVDTSDENEYVVYLLTRGYWDWWRN